MSDGPYRSLQMSRHWKKACEVAQNQAHDAEDLRERTRVALLRDVVENIGTTTLDMIAKILGASAGATGSLDPIGDLEGLRTNLPLPTLNERLIEHAMGAYEGGYRGKDALEQGLQRAVCEHSEARQRQVEEHYRCNEASVAGRDRTRRVRDALREVGGATTVRTVVRQAIDRMNGELGQLAPRRRDALSDGPSAPTHRRELTHA